jgi:hypothetical protein
MHTERDLLEFNYWNKLSTDDRLKLLQDNSFWNGFKNYLWKYLPEHLKAIVVLKIDKNE